MTFADLEVRVQGSRMPNETAWYYDDKTEMDYLPFDDPSDGFIDLNDTETWTLILHNGTYHVREDYDIGYPCLCEIPGVF